MTTDPKPGMTLDDIRAGTRRLAVGSPFIFVAVFAVARFGGIPTGSALLAALALTLLPWLLVFPVIVWGGRALGGLGIFATLRHIVKS